MADLSFDVDPDGTGDYLSLNAWDTAQQQDLTDNGGDTMTAVCQSSSGTADTTGITIFGWTTGAANYIRVWTDPNESYRHDGKWNAAKYRLSIASASEIIQISEEYVRLIGLQLEQTGAGHGIEITWTVPGNYILIDKCIWRSDDNTSGYGITLGETNIILEVKNSSWYSWGWGALLNTSDTVNLYNCTVSDCNGGGSWALQGDSNCTAKNCAVFNSNDDFNGTWAVIDYCASDDGDGTNAVDISPGGVEADDWDDAFVDYANGDFHVKDTGSVLYDAGVDLSGTFTDDIDGDTRSQWDIGADEYVAIGGVAPTAVLYGPLYGPMGGPL